MALWLYGLVFGQESTGNEHTRKRAEAKISQPRSEMALREGLEALMLHTPKMKEERSRLVGVPPVSQIRRIEISSTISNLLKIWTYLDETKIESITDSKRGGGIVEGTAMESEKEDSAISYGPDSRDVQQHGDDDTDWRAWKEREKIEAKLLYLKEKEEHLVEMELRIEKNERRRLEREREAAAERQRIIAEAEARRRNEMEEWKMAEERIIKEYLEKQSRRKAEAKEQRERIITEWEQEKADRLERKKIEREKLLQELREEVKVEVRRHQRSEQRSPYATNPASVASAESKSDTSDHKSPSTIQAHGDTKKLEGAKKFMETLFGQTEHRNPKTYRTSSGTTSLTCISDLDYAQRELNRIWNCKRLHKNDHDHHNQIRQILLGGSQDQSTLQAILNSTLSGKGFVPLFEMDETIIPSVQEPPSYLARSKALTGSLLWQSTSSPGRSELFEALCESGWKPIYTRGTGKCKSSPVAALPG